MLMGMRLLTDETFLTCIHDFDGRELVEDFKRRGGPKSTRNEVNIAAVATDLVKNYRRISSRMIAKSLNIPKTIVRILKEDFCSRDFFGCTIMRPPKKLQMISKF
jgi:hypothetical protein